jgi:hypothetical protein
MKEVCHCTWQPRLLLEPSRGYTALLALPFRQQRRPHTKRR